MDQFIWVAIGFLLMAAIVGPIITYSRMARPRQQQQLGPQQPQQQPAAQQQTGTQTQQQGSQTQPAPARAWYAFAWWGWLLIVGITLAIALGAILFFTGGATLGAISAEALSIPPAVGEYVWIALLVVVGIFGILALIAVLRVMGWILSGIGGWSSASKTKTMAPRDALSIGVAIVIILLLVLYWPQWGPPLAAWLASFEIIPDDLGVAAAIALTVLALWIAMSAFRIGILAGAVTAFVIGVAWYAATHPEHNWGIGRAGLYTRAEAAPETSAACPGIEVEMSVFGSPQPINPGRRCHMEFYIVDGPMQFSGFYDGRAPVEGQTGEPMSIPRFEYVCAPDGYGIIRYRLVNA